MVRGNVSGISYIYPDEFDFDIINRDDVLYSYLNPRAFFMVETSKDRYNADSYDQALLSLFFSNVEKSYTTGSWSEGKQISDIETLDLNGQKGWYGDFSMVQNGMNAFRSDVLLLYCDHRITTFTLICAEEQYDKVKPIFKKIIHSIKEIS